MLLLLLIPAILGLVIFGIFYRRETVNVLGMSAGLLLTIFSIGFIIVASYLSGDVKEVNRTIVIEKMVQEGDTYEIIDNNGNKYEVDAEITTGSHYDYLRKTTVFETSIVPLNVGDEISIKATVTSENFSTEDVVWYLGDEE